MKPYSLPVELTCSPDKLKNGVTMTLVKEFIQKHQVMMQRYRYLEAMYKGFHSIYLDPDKPDWKPDNRLAFNYPRYLTETFLGYAYGIPIKETHPDDAINEKLQEFQRSNELTDHEYELFQAVCIYGHAFEYLYQDEQAQTKMTVCTPKELVVIYDDTVKHKALFAIRYGYKNRAGAATLYGEILTPEEIRGFTGEKLEEPLLNPYERIPVVEYLMNRQRIGLYEHVCCLIEAYNRTASEKQNDVQAFAEAYLKVIGVELTDAQIRKMRDNRVINLEGEDAADKALAEFMAKPSADETQENLLNRLDDQIYQMSMVANISDETFGSATSGVALAYKLQAMSNLALGFDRKIEKSLRKRYKLWSSLETNTTDPDCWKDIDIQTTRNLPQNRLEEAQTAAQLSGIVSRETQLSLLSIVPDPKAELEKMEAEEEEGTGSLITWNGHEEEPDEQ